MILVTPDRDRPMLSFTQRLSTHPDTAPTEAVDFTLALNAEDRVRSRHCFYTEDGQPLHLGLPRGTVLRDGDVLQAESGERLRIVAKPEPVLTVTATQPLDLLRATYHLGNRHVPLEVTATYVRLSPDSVLQTMLEQMGLQVTKDYAPFQPEGGAYGASSARDTHGHDHAHPHAH